MSGWRAGLVAAVVGGMVLGVGIFLDRSSTSPSEPVDPSGPVQVDPGDADAFRLECSPSIATACSALSTTVGVASDTWTPGDPLPERGIVVAPPELLVASGIDVTDAPVVAHSPIVIAGWLERTQVLLSTCSRLDAACVAGAIGSDWVGLGGAATWGDFKMGMVDPTGSEEGMSAWSLLSDALSTEGQERLADSLRIRASSTEALMGEVISFGVSRADVIVTTEAAVVAQFENAKSRGRLEIGYPEAGPWVEYVAVASGRGSDDILVQISSEEARQTLTRVGLRPVDGVVGELPEPMGEPGQQTPDPDAATRARLIALWEQYA